MAVRVVLVDDQALIRAGFKAIIDSAPDLEVVGEADDGADALDVIRAERADVVLMDIRMPGRDGIETTKAITADDDLAGVRVIVLTTFELDEYVVAAMGAGASGFLDKGVDPAVLLDAIRVVAEGEALLTPKATRALLASLPEETASLPVDEAALEHLTAREREVVGLVGQERKSGRH